MELIVSRISPGWVVAQARTGCTSGTAPAEATTAPGASTALLTTLGTGPRRPRTMRSAAPAHDHRLGGHRCGRCLEPEPASRRPGTPDATRVTTLSNRVAYRTTTVSVIVAASDDNTAITLQTSAC